MKWYDWNVLDLWLRVYDSYGLASYLDVITHNAVIAKILNYVSIKLALLFQLLIAPLGLKTTSLFALYMALKFIIFIILMIFIRGGVPRYRYDYLTKIGWIKFLSLVLVLFVMALLLIMSW